MKEFAAVQYSEVWGVDVQTYHGRILESPVANSCPLAPFGYTFGVEALRL